MEQFTITQRIVLLIEKEIMAKDLVDAIGVAKNLSQEDFITTEDEIVESSTRVVCVYENEGYSIEEED